MGEPPISCFSPELRGARSVTKITPKSNRLDNIVVRCNSRLNIRGVVAAWFMREIVMGLNKTPRALALAGFGFVGA